MSKVAEFLSQYPGAEIRGGQIVAIQHAMGDAAQPYFDRVGLHNIDPNGWYSMEKYLAVIYEMLNDHVEVMADMVAVGVKAIDHAALPPNIDSVEKVLGALQIGWKMNSRNAKEQIWATEKVDDNTFICTSSSPFPWDQEYGVLYGFLRRTVKGRSFSVSYENLSDRNDETTREVRFVIKLK